MLSEAVRLKSRRRITMAFIMKATKPPVKVIRTLLETNRDAAGGDGMGVERWLALLGPV